MPEPPDGLTPETVGTWHIWMEGWYAAHWVPEDVPALRLIARLWDQVERGAPSASLRAELRLWLDTYGLTPKGAQDRRWTRPQPVATPANTASGVYRHLRVIADPVAGQFPDTHTAEPGH